MKKLLSVIDIPERSSFYGPDKGISLMKDYALDGFELVYCGQNMNTFSRENIVGLHLPFFADWVNFWLEDHEFLDHDFGSRSAWINFFGGETREDMVDFYQASLRKALELEVEYVVFHVSQVSLDETFTYKARHSDATVINCAIELINAILGPFKEELQTSRLPAPAFLMENLWWAGLNLLDPVLTQNLIDGVDYPNKGFLLDTGHLICAQPSIETEAEAADWIISCLKQHRQLLPYFKGIHLHSSLSRPYVPVSRDLPVWKDLSYEERYAESYYHVEAIDKHELWNLPRLKEILDLLPAEFLVYEFKYNSKEELCNKLRQQVNFVEVALEEGEIHEKIRRTNIS
ncbi:MAG: TIM barrel protein [Clostridiaceae bacterium]|jgi:hypothetical protein|nr:TIM barrel protein [Clostridiaceae bacterium]